MNIDDYKFGTAYITLAKRDFKDEQQFLDLLAFLKLPNDRDTITINVHSLRIIKKETGYEVVDANYS